MYSIYLLEIEDFVLINRILHKERGYDDVGGCFVQILHFALLYVERTVLG